MLQIKELQNHASNKKTTKSSNSSSSAKNAKKPSTSERNSRKTSVERVGDLIAVHNLNETKLMKTLQLGGFAMLC